MIGDLIIDITHHPVRHETPYAEKKKKIAEKKEQGIAH